jgi:hypothetical protein
MDFKLLDISSYLCGPYRFITCNTNIGTVYLLFTDLSDVEWGETIQHCINLATPGFK